MGHVEFLVRLSIEWEYIFLARDFFNYDLSRIVQRINELNTCGESEEYMLPTSDPALRSVGGTFRNLVKKKRERALEKGREEED